VRLTGINGHEPLFRPQEQCAIGLYAASRAFDRGAGKFHADMLVAQGIEHVHLLRQCLEPECPPLVIQRLEAVEDGRQQVFT